MIVSNPQSLTPQHRVEHCTGRWRPGRDMPEGVKGAGSKRPLRRLAKPDHLQVIQRQDCRAPTPRVIEEFGFYRGR